MDGGNELKEQIAKGEEQIKKGTGKLVEQAARIRGQVQKINIARIKEIADGIARVIDIVVGVVMSVMISVVGIQQNADMAQQEAQLAALQLQITQQAQAPTFRLAEDYSQERLNGYKLINDGRLVQCLDIRLEKWLYIQTMGNPLIAFIVPYNMVDIYLPKPAQEESISFYAERAIAETAQQTYSDEETEEPTENDSFVEVDLMEARSFVRDLEGKLKEDKTLGYRIESMEILTLSFIDQEQTYETRRYVIGAKAQENEMGEHPLYIVDEVMWQNMLSQIPENFERMPDDFNNSIYSHMTQVGFQWRRSNDEWQSTLIDDIAKYISSQRTTKKQSSISLFQ